MTARLIEFPGGRQEALDIAVPPRTDDRPMCHRCLRLSSVLAHGRFWCGSCALSEWGAFFYDDHLGSM